MSADVPGDRLLETLLWPALSGSPRANLSLSRLRAHAQSSNEAERGLAVIHAHIALERMLQHWGYLVVTRTEDGGYDRTPIAQAVRAAHKDDRVDKETVKKLRTVSTMRNLYVHDGVLPDEPQCVAVVDVVLRALCEMAGGHCIQPGCDDAVTYVCNTCRRRAACSQHGEPRCECSRWVCSDCTGQVHSKRYSRGPWACAGCNAVVCGSCADEQQKTPRETPYEGDQCNNRWLCESCSSGAEVMDPDPLDFDLEELYTPIVVFGGRPVSPSSPGKWGHRG